MQKTKLFIPPVRERLVDRARLLERLDGLRAEGCRAALISAPAGSGKTTLVAQWLGRAGWPVGWLSLDSRENLPARFFAYLIEALRAAVPGAGSGAFREVLTLIELPGASLEEVITLLANELAEAPRPFVLALDDFHTITNPLLHQALDLFIEAQPPQMRLVLLSREDPSMQLARRRARGQLVELRQDDLRFTLDETVAFLNQSMDLQLSTSQVETLEARTEGWIAGLQMASLALKAPLAGHSVLATHAPDVERFLRDFSGSHRFIMDYLMEEVLAHQPVEVQSFLMMTSILERMCADLCASVTGKTAAEAQELLEQLAKANLFVIPLDEERHWYRYHHLFRDLLLARLQAVNSARAAELELLASDWYEANNDPRLAVEYALKAQDVSRAADLIQRHITERWQTVDLEFQLLVNRLPFEEIARWPSLCLQSAWLSVMFGQAERILPFVEAAERGLAKEGDRSGAVGGEENVLRDANRAFARTLRAYLADLDNQPVELDESPDLAFAAIPEENPGMRNSVAVVMGTICYMEGDFAAAMRFFEEAIALDIRVNGTNAVPISTMRIVYVLKAQGRLHEAVRRLSQSEAYVRERGSRRFYISGVINLLWGDILLEWHRLDEAEVQINVGLRLLEDWPIPPVRSLGLSLLARLNIARGDLASAKAALERAGALQQKNRFHPLFIDAVDRVRVNLYLSEQNREALEDWARETEQQMRHSMPRHGMPGHGFPGRFRYEARLIELCRVWLALGRSQEAVGLLEKLAAAAQERSGSRVNILALMAAARCRDLTPALAALDEALRLAEPEGYLRTFVEAGEPLRQVLESWLQHNRAGDDLRLRAYAHRILAAFEQTSPANHAPVIQPGGLPEPLSQREQEVLLLVTKGLTNQQIADRLVISVRTVKKHVENIHAKLGVQNRTQAAALARALGLLEE